MTSFFKKHTISKPNCPKCGLDKQCESPRQRVVGEGARKILIITQAPDKTEDKYGNQFSGDASRYLEAELKLHGVDLAKDCWKVNAVCCRPPLNSKGDVSEPTAKMAASCRPYIKNLIKEIKPTKIFLFGNTALESYYRERNTDCTSISKMAGLRLWDSTYNTWVFPLLHPTFVERWNYNGMVGSEWSRCIKRAIKYDDKPLKKTWNKTYPTKYFKQAVQALTGCLKYEKLIAIDYETTGLTMYKGGHSTVSFAWATDKGAWSVPVQHPSFTQKEQLEILGLIQKILKKRKIRKIVQGINFEYAWTKQQLKVEPRNICWDTQLATHVLDNRSGITGLKFQSYVRWGIEEYDSKSKLYIRSTATGYNDMLKMPIDALLEYNALDVLYTYELYKEQLTEFVGRELEAYKFLHEGAISLCEMSLNGISIKESYYLQQRALLEKERDELINEINVSKESKQYARRFGAFDYNSPKDLQKMLFDVLKLKPIKQTKTGFSVDEEVLIKINIPLTKKIIKVRKLNKMIGTYVDGFLKHTFNGMMHPSFSLSRARTFRSSSQWPNFQNVPKRDPKAKRITRSGMVPRPGRVLGEMDFEGAEISTSCYYHKDPTFIKYQTEGGGDMHKDACAEILKIKPDDVPKDARQITKGIWTFAQFYGSYYANCAKQGWEEYPQLTDKEDNPVKIKGVPIDEHMEKTFPTYKEFETHLKKFENKFWNVWFKVYTEWKDIVAKQYKRTGFVETFLGFRFKGQMDSKKCSNYPIQGTSFHLLLYTATQFIKETKKRKLKTLAIGQIHDSLILDIPLNEIEEVSSIMNDIVLNLHKTFDWMDFPMGLDFEISDSYELGGSFANMQNINKV